MTHGNCLFSFITLIAFADTAWAQGERQQPTLSDAQVRERVVYLEHTLDDGRTYADYWWKGWTAFYGLGVIIQSVQAGMDDSSGTRADHIVGAVKATGGVISQFFRPMLAAEGADPVRALPSETADDRMKQLLAAEDLLRRNAEQADGRYSWKRHLGNVGTNVAGALIVWQGFGERTRAWRSAGVGIAVGEVMIWSQPWWSRDDLEEYERRFSTDMPAQPRVSWNLVPTFGGAALEATF